MIVVCKPEESKNGLINYGKTQLIYSVSLDIPVRTLRMLFR